MPPAPQSPPKPEPIVLGSPLFMVLLWIVAGLCFATLIIRTLLAIFGKDPATDAQKNLMNVCTYGFTTTLGAIIGLLCGRAAGPDALRQPPTT